MRRRVWGLLILLVTLGAASIAGPAAADDDSRTYEGTWEVSQCNPDFPCLNGTAGSIRVTCSGDVCEVKTPQLATFINGPKSLTVSGETEHIAVSPACPGDIASTHGAQSIDVTLTATDLVVDWTQSKGSLSGCRYNDVHIVFTGSRPAPTEPAPTTPAVPTQDASPDGGSSAGDSDEGDEGAESDESAGSDESSTSELSTGRWDAPSVLTSLPAPADVEPGNALVGIALTVVLVLLVAFPTTLLNSATETGADRFSEWWQRRRRRDPEPTKATDGRWWFAAGGVLAAGVISAFVDPELGLNAGSVRTMLSVMVSFFVEVVLGWAVTVWAVRRFAPGAAASYTFKPATLVIVVLAVVFTRVTGFEPGIVFGLVAGVTFATLAGSAGEARSALTAQGYGAAVGILAWVLYGILDHPTGAAGVFVSESLAAAAVAGLAALPIALFPVPGLPGGHVFEWSKRTWALCYAFGLIAFFVVLMPTPYAWDDVGWSLRSWVLGYLCYLLLAVALWAMVQRSSRTPTPVN